MCVGTKIKAYLDERGITQAHISRETGIPLPKLNLSLNGKRRLEFEEYELICGAIDVSTAMFLEPKKPTLASRQDGT